MIEVITASSTSGNFFLVSRCAITLPVTKSPVRQCSSRDASLTSSSSSFASRGCAASFNRTLPRNVDGSDQPSKDSIASERFIFCRTISGQPRGPSEDGVSDAGKSPEDGQLPALCCTGWLGRVLVDSTVMAIPFLRADNLRPLFKTVWSLAFFVIVGGRDAQNLSSIQPVLHDIASDSSFLLLIRYPIHESDGQWLNWLGKHPRNSVLRHRK